MPIFVIFESTIADCFSDDVDKNNLNHEHHELLKNYHHRHCDHCRTKSRRTSDLTMRKASHIRSDTRWSNFHSCLQSPFTDLQLTILSNTIASMKMTLCCVTFFESYSFYIHILVK